MGFVGGAATGASAGAAFGPWGAGIGAVVGGIGGWLGRDKGPQWKDANLYAMNEGQRNNLGNAAYGQQMQQYKTDPHAFWGGQNAWTTLGGVGNSGDIRKMLYGKGGALGGGSGSGGGAVGVGGGGRVRDTQAYQATPIDLDQDIYQLNPPSKLRENFLARLRSGVDSSTQDMNRTLDDQGTLSGMDASALAQLKAKNSRQGAQSIWGGYGQWDESWRGRAEGRRENAIQSNFGERQRYAGAQQSRDASNQSADLGQRGQNIQKGIAQANLAESARGRAMASGQFQQGLNAQMAQFMIGTRGQDEDRMLDRYKLQHQMNQDWQAPNASLTQYQGGGGAMQSVSQGAGLGMTVGNQIGGWLGNRRKTNQNQINVPGYGSGYGGHG